MKQMQLKSIIREWKEKHEGVEKSTRSKTERKGLAGRGRSYIAPKRSPPSPSSLNEQSEWANLPPELLLEIIRRVEATETSWPARRSVVACAAICKSWREVVKEVIRTPEECGLLTFPMSLKQPGPRDSPLQCFIKRERATSIFRLYLGLSPALSGDAGKLLLAAKKVRKATNTVFYISLSADDFSRASCSYIGKLRSNFFVTKFAIYDSQPPCNSATKSSGWLHKNTFSRKMSQKLALGSYNVATICYELNVLHTRGPRRMQCTMHAIPVSAIQEGGTAPTPATFADGLDGKSPFLSIPREQNQACTSSSLLEPFEATENNGSSLVLKNKAPRWHQQLQCWCLNFKGRVTVASVKNFQLVAAVDSLHNVPRKEQEKVILQFGKIGKDIFTMDYRYPLSAFQAFAICLSSFDTKPACE